MNARALILVPALLVSACEAPEPPVLLGGQASIYDATPNAFSQPAPGLERDQELLFFVGNSFFNQNWVTAPSSTEARDGLGPLFNARSCAGCHFKDGRGHPPGEGEFGSGLLLRLSIHTRGTDGAYLPDPGYGGQIQDGGIEGVPREGRIVIEYEEVPGTFPDSSTFSLRRPRYRLEDVGYGPLTADVQVSPRVAPQMIGMGLLEAIPEEQIRALADPDDDDGDGVSGRPNEVWNAVEATTSLGRFGWKANVPSVRQQAAGAFLGDMGITTSIFPVEECTTVQGECAGSQRGGDPEIADEDFDKVVLYASSLAVPAMRDAEDPTVREGARAFAQVGCPSCHVPTLRTGLDAAIPALSDQLIHPYTDLLLHDMGEGLADGRPDFEADGREWRTAPLWGVGLIPTVNRHSYYLHDGRARDLEEAILWHGGEAGGSRDRFMSLPAATREALIRFLESL